MSTQARGLITITVHELDNIQTALQILMGQLYDHVDSSTDPQATHADCASWGDGLSWLAQSIKRVRDGLDGARVAATGSASS